MLIYSDHTVPLNIFSFLDCLPLEGRDGTVPFFCPPSALIYFIFKAESEIERGTGRDKGERERGRNTE